MPSIPIGLQLYSVREDCERDLPGTLAAVAEMGYAGVEFAGYYGRGARELRGMLDDLGLRCCGTHIGLNTLLGDEQAKTVAFNQELGNPYLIVPGLPEERRNSRAAWLGTAHIFNEIAEQLKPHGMRTGYHNHWVEFQPLDGELPWDTFFGNTAPGVIMQLDTGNALHGGADPVPYLSRYPGGRSRCTSRNGTRTTRWRCSAKARPTGRSCSICARRAGPQNGTSWSRRATRMRRWKWCGGAWRICGRWGRRRGQASNVRSLWEGMAFGDEGCGEGRRMGGYVAFAIAAHGEPRRGVGVMRRSPSRHMTCRGGWVIMRRAPSRRPTINGSGWK